MSSEFDPSPRSSKRRKIIRYGTERTILPEGTQVEDNSPSAGQFAASKSITPKTRSSDRKPKWGSGSRQSPQPKNNRPIVENARADIDQHDLSATSSKSPRQSNGTKTRHESPMNGDGPRVNDQRDAVDDGSEQTERNGHTTEPAKDDDTPKVRSSGRQRKKPNRFAEAVEDIPVLKPTIVAAIQSESPERSIASPVIKGILTPSRGQKTSRPRKSVMFDQDEATIGEQFGFKDIDTPAKTSARKSVEKRPPRQTALIARELLLEDLEPEVEPQNEDELPDETITHDPQVDVSVPYAPLDEVIPVTLAATEDDGLHAIKSQVFARLTSASLPGALPPHLESQYKQLHDLLESTIVSSESNSLLLLGPRGAGKSTLLSLALRSLTSQYSSEFHTVQLNGFLQTDDRLALREIWRQLGREMHVDEIETEDVAGSYADTMASLLSLLSHPDEIQVDDQTGREDVETLASNAVQIAAGGQRTSKSIVFILDEFDLFTNHPRQTLLYNLFDIAQSRKAPIIVIGCSTRMDVIECLEKRVKSRFSHRWLLISNCKTFLEWENLVKQTLLVEGHRKILSEPQQQDVWKEAWNKHIQTTFLPSEKIQSLLKSHFYTTKSLPDVFTALYPLVATVSLPSHPITPRPTDHSCNRSPDIVSFLPTLPTLHTTLLISTSRLHTIHHLPSTNFNLIYTHYTELIAQSRLRQSAGGSLAVCGSLRAWSRDTCRGAWEDLGRWGVVTPVVGGREDGDGDWGGGDGWETRMWRCEVTLEDLRWGVLEAGGEGGGLERWCKEV